jgi:hypothetical protein
MNKLIMILGAVALTSCNGSFTAGYLIHSEWDNYTERPYEEDELFACVTVSSDDTYTVDNSGSVG